MPTQSPSDGAESAQPADAIPAAEPDPAGDRARAGGLGRLGRLSRLDGIGVRVRHATPAVGPLASRAAERVLAPIRKRGGARATPRGMVFYGTVWTGGDAEPFADGAVVLDGQSRVVAVGPRAALDISADLPAYGDHESWIGPGICDAHVHLAFGGLDESLAAGLIGLRDLGAPRHRAAALRTGHGRPSRGKPFVAASGPMLTSTGGYPSRSWGADGFAVFADTPADARHAVRDLAVSGADVIKIALEPRHGWPVMGPATVRAAVDTAHAAGLAVVAHALSAEMVVRAVSGGVDELAHTPTERLDSEVIEQLADRRIAVVSTLQIFFSEGAGRTAAANATDLVAAGVVLRYGTDLGNAGTRPGVDPRELDRLADAGLGRLGALRAATRASAQAPGMRRRNGLLRMGEPAALVLLPADPLSEPGAWRAPSAVVADGRLIQPIPADGDGPATAEAAAPSPNRHV
jgi:imidazolonepropionase-like amidohydrolase